MDYRDAKKTLNIFPITYKPKQFFPGDAHSVMALLWQPASKPDQGGGPQALFAHHADLKSIVR